MIIRQKDGAIRITKDDPKKIGQVSYLLIDPNNCWCSTFNAWGKPATEPVIHLGGKNYRVELREVD